MLYDRRVSPLIETAVLAANRAFYKAFAERNVRAMLQLWAREHVVACIHPGWAPLHGSEAVLASWKAILGSQEAPRIRFTDPAAVVFGDAAVVTCVEHIRDAELAATNVFALENGEWRLVHHHAGPMAATGESRRPVVTALN
jgi:ketosteroid isomerase-like protein